MDTSIEPSLQTIETALPVIQGKKFWPRAVTYIIDDAILFGLNVLTGLCAGTVLGILLTIFVISTGRNYSIAENSSTFLNIIVGLIISIIYFWIFEGMVGRTIGKMVLKMRVITSKGEIPSFKQAFTRSIYRLIDGFFFGLVAASTMKAPGYQRFGDQKAATFVVSSDDTAVKTYPPSWKFWLALLIFLFLDFMINFICLLTYIRVD